MMSQEGFARSISVSDRIARDREATDLLFHMIQSGNEVLFNNWHYKKYREMLKEVIFKNDHFKEYRINNEEETLGDKVVSFFWGGDEKAEDQVKLVQSTERLVNNFIEELLRFLAMKILVETRAGTPYTNTRYNERQGLSKEQKMRKVLFPSEPINEAWLALMLFPVTYGEVCIAMGSNSALDYNDDSDLNTGDIDYTRSSILLQGKLSRKMWSLECYGWTLETYDQLFNGEPSPIYWPIVGESSSVEEREADDNDWRSKSVRTFRDSYQVIKQTAQNSCVTLSTSSNNVTGDVPKCVQYMSPQGCDGSSHCSSFER